jgi:hypothetical protein
VLWRFGTIGELSGRPKAQQIWSNMDRPVRNRIACRRKRSRVSRENALESSFPLPDQKAQVIERTEPLNCGPVLSADIPTRAAVQTQNSRRSKNVAAQMLAIR